MPGRLIPTSGGGDVDLTPVTSRLSVMEEAVNEDLAPRVTVVEEALPEKVSSAQVDAKIAAKSSKFRGEWTTGDLAYTNDFSSGLTDGWTGGANITTLGWAGRDDRNPNPPVPEYGGVLRISGGAVATFNPELVPALAGKALISASFWAAESGGTSQFLENGTVKASHYAGSFPSWSPWVKYTVALSDNGLFGFYGDGNYAYYTGLEVYIAAQPYMLGEFVLSKGKMWKSKANNNGTTPGVSASWEEVAVNFQQTYSTSGRPSASTSGKGAQIYDQDLNLPLYSNGTAWTDAAGTVR